ncbi:LrgB family protein [Bacillus thermotolerans]|uniref:LrgA-associated membrane protein LrgB n=1 Tax=Bacillus thermotolerans TaxID=1221996 RepID=A0A0F5I178_BACTR|nr:LrgB family protein [Bacillus thermotolerans]KKB39015.1 LrgA-associated membrane protein LrgB [Bacillus thermotolerans]
MSSVTLFSILLTVAVYWVSRRLAIRFPSPLLTPVFSSTVVIVFILLWSGITYEEYTPAKDIMTYLLGPATVALAVPLYHNLNILLKKAWPSLLGLVAGTAATIVSGVVLAKLFHFSEEMTGAVAVKSVTSPVAFDVANVIGGDPVLAAVFVIISGVFGAVAGPWVLTALRITDPFARGLSIGTTAHGVGTSQMVVEGEMQGAVSGAAMGAAAILVSIILPWLFPLIQ